MISTLAYLHSNDFFHRDFKPANILLQYTDNGINFILCDFGEG